MQVERGPFTTKDAKDAEAMITENGCALMTWILFVSFASLVVE